MKNNMPLEYPLKSRKKVVDSMNVKRLITGPLYGARPRQMGWSCVLILESGKRLLMDFAKEPNFLLNSFGFNLGPIDEQY